MVNSSFNLTLKSQVVYVDTYRWVDTFLWSHGVLQKNREVHFIEYGRGPPLWNCYQGNIKFKTSGASRVNEWVDIV